LVDLYDSALAHIESDPGITLDISACPAMQGEQVGFSIVATCRQDNFPVVTISGGVWLPVNVRQRFRVAEVVRITQRKKQGHWQVGAPLCWHLKPGAQNKVGSPGSPIGLREDDLPFTVIYLVFEGRVFEWAGQGFVAKRWDGMPLPVDQGFGQIYALCNFLRCPPDFV
jgi:hypothetical protein